MFNDQPDLPGQGKLVLPAYREEHYRPPVQTQHVYVHPDQLRSQTPLTVGNPLVKLRTLWGLDPAYRVLMVAITMVIVAGLVFSVFLVNAFAQTASMVTTPRMTTATGPVAVTATSVANVPPTFPTPSGGQGSNQSSLPPASAPVVLPTLTPSGQGDQQVALQIVNVDQQVANNSTVPVTVTANQPGVAVGLQITYDLAAPNTVGPKETGGDGTVTLNWHVKVRNFGFKMNQVARITAFAFDQNGQQIQSQTVSVQIANQQFN